MTASTGSRPTFEALDRWLFGQFVCPVDHRPLVRQGNWLVNSGDPARRYPIANGVPVFLRDDVEHTAWWSKESLRLACRIADGAETLQEPEWAGPGVHPHVQSIIDSTGGHLYQACRGRLAEYPIPRIRVEPSGADQLLLDAGCNWGRWVFAAARAGIRSVGFDPSLTAVLAARQIRHQLDLPCAFFVGDCRWLPFADHSFSNVFSYSVIQHFSKPDAQASIREFRRVLRAQGRCLVQMPNALGVRSLYHLLRRRFHAGKQFDVRYYTPRELRRTFREVFGNCRLSVDGFFGLGIQADDLRFMPARNRLVIHASEALRAATAVLPPLGNLADSLYADSVRGDD